jgi:hypothetical protein
MHNWLAFRGTRTGQKRFRAASSNIVLNVVAHRSDGVRQIRSALCAVGVVLIVIIMFHRFMKAPPVRHSQSRFFARG